VKLLEVVWNFPDTVMKPFDMYYFYWPLKEALRRGWEAEVLTFQVTSGQPVEEIIDGIRVRRCPANGRKGRIWSLAFIRALLATDADIVHFHGYGEGRRELALLISRLKKQRIVFTPHFHPAYPENRWRRKIYDRIIGRRIFNMSGRIIVFTDYTAQQLSVLGVDMHRVRIVPHVARPDIFASTLGEPPIGGLLKARGVIGSPLILGVGQFIERKGWEYTLRCLPVLVQHFPQIRLLIIGSSKPAEPKFEQRFFQLVAELGVHEHVQLLQDNSPEFIRDAYRGATVLTHPSFIESFGMVFLEAMAAGLPIVAHNGTGIPCVVEDGTCGYLVDVRDTELYTQRLLAILSDAELRQRMGQEGLHQARNRFSEARIADQLCTVYAELLGQSVETVMDVLS
jgi:glycosyltransferase involved in cell wall biosynthesis